MSSENLSASDNPSAGTPSAHGNIAHMATDDPHAGLRAVVFPEAEIREEKIAAAALRPKGVEMKRTLTQEEKDLAAAGYDHLKPKDEGGANVAATADITEHHLDFEALGDELKTHFDTKEPDHSHGLTSDEAKLRLQRDGANVLTPPKKKSAFRKVCF